MIVIDKARVEIMKKMYADGYSYEDIADEFRLTALFAKSIIELL